MIKGRGGAEIWVAVVPVDPLCLDFLAVNVNHLVLDFYFPESRLQADIFAAAVNAEGIEVRRLVAPELGAGDKQLKAALLVDNNAPGRHPGPGG